MVGADSVPKKLGNNNFTINAKLNFWGTVNGEYYESKPTFKITYKDGTLTGSASASYGTHYAVVQINSITFN